MFANTHSPQNPFSFRLFLSTLPIHIVGAIVLWAGIVLCFWIYGRYPPNTKDCFAVHFHLDTAFVFGAGLGVIGTLFQAAAIRKLLGAVRRKTVVRLGLMWGLLSGTLCFGVAQFIDIDSRSYEFCLKGSPLSLISDIMDMLFVLILPTPIALLVAWVVMHLTWRDETKWQTRQNSDVNVNNTDAT